MLQVVTMQHVAFLYHHFVLDVVEFIALKQLVPKQRNPSIWKHERLNEYMEQHLFGNYMVKMF